MFVCSSKDALLPFHLWPSCFTALCLSRSFTLDNCFKLCHYLAECAPCTCSAFNQTLRKGAEGKYYGAFGLRDLMTPLSASNCIVCPTVLSSLSCWAKLMNRHQHFYFSPGWDEARELRFTSLLVGNRVKSQRGFSLGLRVHVEVISYFMVHCIHRIDWEADDVSGL